MGREVSEVCCTCAGIRLVRGDGHSVEERALARREMVGRGVCESVAPTGAHMCAPCASLAGSVPALKNVRLPVGKSQKGVEGEAAIDERASCPPAHSGPRVFVDVFAPVPPFPPRLLLFEPFRSLPSGVAFLFPLASALELSPACLCFVGSCLFVVVGRSQPL